MNDILLAIENLNYAYNTKKIFNNINFNVRKSEILTLIGSNNCGKTTIIKLLSGILGSNNNINLNGMYLNKKNFKHYCRKIGVMVGDFNNQFIFDNIAQELSFPLENLKYEKSYIRKRVKYLMNLFSLSYNDNYLLSELSYYEKIKLLIALTIIHNPVIVFLDNPFQKLSFIEKIEILKIIRTISSTENISFVITTSDLTEILYSDRSYVIHDKKIVMEGNYHEILKHDNKLIKMGISIPVMVDVCLKLSFYNLLETIHLDVDGLVYDLWK